MKHDDVFLKHILDETRSFHACFGVNWDIVDDVIENHIPKLNEAVKRLLRERKRSSER